MVLLTVDVLNQDVVGPHNHYSKLTPSLDPIVDHCMILNRAQSIGPHAEIRGY